MPSLEYGGRRFRQPEKYAGQPQNIRPEQVCEPSGDTPGEAARGMSPRASLRIGHEPLGASGSHHLNTPVMSISQLFRRHLSF